MDAELRLAGVPTSWDGDLGRAGREVEDGPSVRGAGVADGCAFAAAKDTGHPLALPGDLRTANRINTWHQDVEASGLRPVSNALAGQPSGEELVSRHHAVLPTDGLPEPSNLLNVSCPYRGIRRSAD